MCGVPSCAGGLTQRQAEQAFDGQAKLDGGIAEGGGSARPDGQGASGYSGHAIQYAIHILFGHIARYGIHAVGFG